MHKNRRELRKCYKNKKTPFKTSKSQQQLCQRKLITQPKISQISLSQQTEN